MSVRAERARAFLAGDNTVLAEDSRVWYERREGPGEKRDPEGKDAYADWDEWFQATKEYSFAGESGDSVVFVLTENNNFYRLIDRPPSRVRLTYWFDERNRITGTLVRGMPNDPTRGDRLPEFKRWLAANHPDELAYLLPEGRIVPDLERAKRWSALLMLWRRAR